MFLIYTKYINKKITIIYITHFFNIWPLEKVLVNYACVVYAEKKSSKPRKTKSNIHLCVYKLKSEI